MPEMTKVRELFTASDAIEWARPDALGRIFIVRDGTVWLADLATGELLQDLPGLETKRSSRILFNDRVLTFGDDTVSIYDLKSKRVLTTYSGRVWAEQIDSVLWALHAPWPNARNGVKKQEPMLVVDIVTGQVDHRFDPVGPFQSAFASPDGKTVALGAEKTLAVCDVSSGKRMWSMPKEDSGRLRFEQDSTVIAADVLDESKRVRTARWRVADGSVIDPLPASRSGRPTANLSRDTDRNSRFAVDHRSFQRGPIAAALGRTKEQVNRWTGAKNSPWSPDWERIGEVRDLAADELIGVYSYEPWDQIIAPDGSGFISFSGEDYGEKRLRYYRLPPRRDWGWPVRWGVMPAAALVALQVFLWVIRARGQLVVDPASIRTQANEKAQGL